MELKLEPRVVLLICIIKTILRATYLVYTPSILIFQNEENIIYHQLKLQNSIH
jgi:hypothetical protein